MFLKCFLGWIEFLFTTKRYQNLGVNFKQYLEVLLGIVWIRER